MRACVAVLMMIAVTAFLGLAGALPARAASPGFCETYADHAISEQSANQSLNCQLTGPRWNSDRMPHLTWCLLAQQQSGENEAVWRLHDLGNCSLQGACDQYAKNAIADNNAQNALGCRFDGPRWNSTFEGHASWCRAARWSSVDGEVVGRLRDMDLCRTCAEYAGKAVDANRQNIAHNCGYTGPRWNSDPQGHIPWCLGARMESRASEEGARANDLAACYARNR